MWTTEATCVKIITTLYTCGWMGVGMLVCILLLFYWSETQMINTRVLQYSCMVFGEYCWAAGVCSHCFLFSLGFSWTLHLHSASISAQLKLCLTHPTTSLAQSKLTTTSGGVDAQYARTGFQDTSSIIFKDTNLDWRKLTIPPASCFVLLLKWIVCLCLVVE